MGASEPGLEPLGAAPAAMVSVRPVAEAAIAVLAAAIHAALPPALAAEPVSPVCQDGEPALLAFVEGLVQRVSRIGDLLHRGRRGSHIVGAAAQARHRILRLLRGIRLGGHPALGSDRPARWA